MKKYEVLKAQYVIETLGKGSKVLCVDFQSMKIIDCEDLTIKAINSYIADTTVVFYKVTEVAPNE